jgi:hypothetical protein
MKSNDSFAHNLWSDFHMTQRTLAPVRFSDGLTGSRVTEYSFLPLESSDICRSNNLDRLSKAEDIANDFGLSSGAVLGDRLTTVCRVLKRLT